MLRNTFSNDAHVRVCKFDLGGDVPAELGSGFDSIVCLNVLEHVEDDARALRHLHDLLAPNGRLVLIVPALQSLYGEIDRAIGHYRRYERADLVEKLRAAGFSIEHHSAFNVIGALGWFVNGRLLKRRTVPGVQARINDCLVPLLRLEDHLRPPIGLSWLMVGQRNG
jgi:SAM-dependent methyltransferase